MSSIPGAESRCQSGHLLIVFRLMRKGTFDAALDPSPVLLPDHRISRTVLQRIERTVTEQAVDMLRSLMAGIVFTRAVLEITAAVLIHLMIFFHVASPP